ncbi:MAG TPA: carbohydrate porin [Steroidobacteraceae bacterium]|nr:carbohydrate porin [Steroidobacteraceae bacterium]
MNADQTRKRRCRAPHVAMSGAMLGMAVLAVAMSAWGATGDPGAQAPAASTPWFAYYGQATYTEQATDGFHAPYSAGNSLSPHIARETFDLTLFLGAHLWQGGEIWMSPEIDQGFGLDDTVGLAGFSSGEAYKVGRSTPYYRLQRAFVRETFDLGGASTVPDAGPNQFAFASSSNRLVVTAGKLSVVDIFDVNRYAHDPRADFLNWSVIDAGTFDYAADSWGYSAGGAAEWYVGNWTTRAGLFELSTVPNGETLEPGLEGYQMDVELEHRHELFGQVGKLDVTAFESRGRMALLAQAVAYAQAAELPVELAPVRQYRKRDGISLNLEQPLGADLGVFVRLGSAAGDVETYEFTDIDRTASGGVSLNGRRWGRSGDTVGLAGVDNAISNPQRNYLAAGGLATLVGDGRLPHPGNEQILEGYYEAAVISAFTATLDAQWVQNPAYNRDRGPVAIYALRLHAGW